MTDHDPQSSVQVPCRVPDSGHEEDTVFLRPKLGLASGVKLQRAMQDFLLAEGRNREDVMLGVLVEYYVLEGVTNWTLHDQAGPIPCNPETIRRELLDDFERARPVADKADDLYKEPVLGPLLRRVSNSSRATSTNGSTSPTPATSGKRPKRSKRSSTSTSQTDDTAATSA